MNTSAVAGIFISYIDKYAKSWRIRKRAQRSSITPFKKNDKIISMIKIAVNEFFVVSAYYSMASTSIPFGSYGGIVPTNGNSILTGKPDYYDINMLGSLMRILMLS